jgi:hypothetical protein
MLIPNALQYYVITQYNARLQSKILTIGDYEVCWNVAVFGYVAIN